MSANAEPPVPCRSASIGTVGALSQEEADGAGADGADGRLEYRCAAEPTVHYAKKGGKSEETVGHKCLCNARMANIGLPQVHPKGYVEKTLVTAGDDLMRVRLFLQKEDPSYAAEEVIHYLLEAGGDGVS